MRKVTNPKSIHDTAVVPYIIAEKAIASVIKKDARCKDMPEQEERDLTWEATDLLSDKAERIYANNVGFQEKIDSNRTDCRQVLQMFMEHWFQLLLDQHLKGQELTFDR